MAPSSKGKAIGEICQAVATSARAITPLTCHTARSCGAHGRGCPQKLQLHDRFGADCRRGASPLSLAAAAASLGRPERPAPDSHSPLLPLLQASIWAHVSGQE